VRDLQFNDFVIIQVHVLADTGDNDAGTLHLCLFHQDLTHDIRIAVIQMTDGLIG
jgi:hypothetical protein